mgnify:CR=1 FL=1
MRLSLLIFLVFPFLSSGQSYFKDHFGGTVGLVLNFGTHVTSAGINIKGYWLNQAGFDIDMPLLVEVSEGKIVLTVAPL